MNLADHVLVTRINLCCAAFGLFVFAMLEDDIGGGGKALTLVASALLVFLARQMGTILRRIEATPPEKGGEPLVHHYLLPF